MRAASRRRRATNRRRIRKSGIEHLYPLPEPTKDSTAGTYRVIFGLAAVIQRFQGMLGTFACAFYHLGQRWSSASLKVVKSRSMRRRRLPDLVQQHTSSRSLPPLDRPSRRRPLRKPSPPDCCCLGRADVSHPCEPRYPPASRARRYTRDCPFAGALRSDDPG